MKKTLSLVLVLALLCSFACPVVHAADSDVEKLENAIRVVTDSISEAKQIFPDLKTANTISGMFDEFVSVARNTGTFLSIVNGSVTFLKLIGLVQDSKDEALANIQTQLQAINDQLEATQKQLNTITTQMAQLQASEEFNARTEKAIMLKNNWNDFEYRYVENGMDSLMMQYNGMLLNGMQSWCLNKTADARTKDGADLSEIVLHYVPADGEYRLSYTAENEEPSNFDSADRYLVLSSDFLPASVSWNANSYRTAIIDYIAEKIRQYAENGNYDAFECGGFPAFTEEGSAELTDDLVRQVAEDALNVLTYKVAATEINKDSMFSLEVEKQFNNYCKHLLAPEEGMDAMFCVFYLTHAFEYQISDALKLFCNEMAIKTGVYGSFATDVLSMSSFVTQKQKTDMLDSYCDVLIKIGQAKDNCVKGNDRYCYLTGKELYFGTITFTNRMSVNTREASSKRAYESYSASAAETKLSGDWRYSDTPSLIGDANALLLTYMLQSNGDSVDLRNLRTALGSSADNIGTIVTSTNGEQALPLNSDVSMELTNVIGSYFRSGAAASLRNLPEDADSDYIRYRRMITGSVIDASGELEVNKVLDAAAVYGENHWYWEKDEAAFLGGAECPNCFSKSTEKIQTRLEFPGTYYYRTEYTQHIAYNCLVSVPLGKSFARGQYSPLREYERMCEEFGKTEQKTAWDPEPEITGSFAAFEKTGSGFSDIPENAYYSDAVRWAAENGVTNGTDAAHFSPDTGCTRAQAVTFLWRAAGCPEDATTDTFRDVVRGSYYEKAVAWAVAEGITMGTSALAFSPDAVCTRAQMITFLYRFAGAESGHFAISLTDVAADAYYYDAVAWAYANDVAGGTSSTTFSPDAVCTRAQAVTFLHRLLYT